jgi:hypothetical protein
MSPTEEIYMQLLYYALKDELYKLINDILIKKIILDYSLSNNFHLESKQLSFLNKKLFLSPALVSFILQTTEFNKNLEKEYSKFILNVDELENLSLLLRSSEFQAKAFHYDIILYSNSHFTPLQVYSLENKIKIFSVDAMPSHLDEIKNFAEKINADLIQYDAEKEINYFFQQSTYGCDIFALSYLEEMSQLKESKKSNCCSLQGIDPKFLVFTQSLSALEELKNTRHSLYHETIN